MNVAVSSPVYFSKDFRRQIRFEYKSKEKQAHGDIGGGSSQYLRSSMSNSLDDADGKSRLQIVVY